MEARKFEIRRVSHRPGWVDVLTGDVRVFAMHQGGWAREGPVTLFDADGGCAAWLSEPPGAPGEVVVTRPGQVRHSVRRAMAPRGTGHWNVHRGDGLAMSVFGDMLAAQAVIQQDARVVAEVTAEGLGEYSVVCHWRVDPPLVLAVVLAIDHLGH